MKPRIMKTTPWKESFWCGSNEHSIVGTHRSLSSPCDWPSSSPKSTPARPSPGGYCTQKALWKLSWFLRDFGYDPDLLGRDEVDEKALLGLRGVVRTSRTTLNGRSFLNLEAFAPAGEWEELSVEAVSSSAGEENRGADDL